MDNIQQLREQIINLNNSDEFKQLNHYYKKKSFFNILGISRKETIHSYFLHWLFSPEESHELNDFALRRLLELIVLVKNRLQYQNNQLQFPDNIEDDIICGGYTLDRIECHREHVTTQNDRLDLFLSFEFHSIQAEKHLNIILENKVKSKERSEQTNRYYHYGKELDGETIYLFLSPLSNSDFESLTHPICQCKKFVGLNYQYLVDYVLEPCLSECIVSDAKVFIEEYLRTLSQPSLQFEDFDGGEVIMAVSSRERDLLLNFWENNKDLLTAALNALADNPELEQVEREQIRESIQAVTKSTRRDHTKYQFEGEAYAKNRLVLAVVKKHVECHPNITFSELIQTFSHSNLPTIIVPLEEAQKIAERSGQPRHFIDMPIRLMDAEVAVNNQWGAGIIEPFIDLANQLGYSVHPINQTDEIRGWIRNLLDIARTKGDSYLDILAGDIIRDKLQGDYNKNALVCAAMKSLMGENDKILYSPPSGISSKLEIRYYL